MTATGFGGGPVPLSISTACGGPLSLSTAAAADRAQVVQNIAVGQHYSTSTPPTTDCISIERGVQHLPGGCCPGGLAGVPSTTPPSKVKK